MLSTSGKFAFAILLLSASSIAPAQQIVIGQYVLPTPDAAPVSIAEGAGRSAVVHRIQPQQHWAHHYHRGDH
jgi:hypothetical protein